MDVLDLIRDPSKVDELIERLDALAREQSSYEYGLPLWDEPQKARLREAVYQWAASPLPSPSETAA